MVVHKIGTVKQGRWVKKSGIWNPSRLSPKREKYVVQELSRNGAKLTRVQVKDEWWWLLWSGAVSASQVWIQQQYVTRIRSQLTTWIYWRIELFQQDLFFFSNGTAVFPRWKCQYSSTVKKSKSRPHWESLGCSGKVWLSHHQFKNLTEKSIKRNIVSMSLLKWCQSKSVS